MPYFSRHSQVPGHRVLDEKADARYDSRVVTFRSSARRAWSEVAIHEVITAHHRARCLPCVFPRVWRRRGWGGVARCGDRRSRSRGYRGHWGDSRNGRRRGRDSRDGRQRWRSRRRWGGWVRRHVRHGRLGRHRGDGRCRRLGWQRRQSFLRQRVELRNRRLRPCHADLRSIDMRSRRLPIVCWLPPVHLPRAGQRTRRLLPGLQSLRRVWELRFRRLLPGAIRR
jgi:hypothetical protein